MTHAPDYETMPAQDLARLQLERLESTLFRVAKNVPFYRERFDALGFDPEELRSLDDLAALPFTTKADIRDHYPYGLFAVPLREVVRLQASSGTTGLATVVGYTKNDLARWADLVARVLTMAGLDRDDVVQVAFGYGLFTGGFGLHQGAERLGASVIPSSAGRTRRQVQIMRDYRTTALASTPGYALHMAEVLEEMDIPLAALSLRRGLLGGEPFSEALRGQLESRLGMEVYDNYGVSEVMGPGVAGECAEKNGMHLAEDHFLMEVVDPETGAPVAEGEAGELVLTTLTREAFPMLRFRTGDLTRVLPGPCPCGRSHRRIARITGRADDMLIVRGVNVFPSQVEAVLMQFEATAPHYRVILTREAGLDKATVQVEVTEGLLSDRLGGATSLVEEMERRMESELGVHMDISLVEPKTLDRAGDGKVERVLDRREAPDAEAAMAQVRP